MDNVAKYGKTLEEIERELMLGNIPDDLTDDDDDDEDVNIFDEQYDAANEETFGGGVNDVDVDDAELEDYAAQTARLRLDDPIWNNASSSAAAPDAPDASQIPLPTSIFGGAKGNNTEGISSFLDQSLWTNPIENKTPGYSLWGNFGTGTFDMSKDVGHISSFVGETPTIEKKSSQVEILAMPQSALTLEDLERDVISSNQLLENGEGGNTSIQQPLPSLPASALSLDEIEKELIKCTQSLSLNESKQEATKTGKWSSEDREKHEHTPQQNNSVQPFPQMPFMHPMYMMPPPMIPMQNLPRVPPIHPFFLKFLPIWIDSIVRRMALPPGFPPVPEYLFALLNQFKNPALVYHIVVRSSIPPQFPSHPQPFMQRFDNNCHGMQNSNAPTGNSSPQQGRYNRLPGMPSSRTIHDLAIDSFAGFLSMKEREYLINIQLKSVDVDDHYYKTWKEMQIKRGWKPTPVEEKPVVPESKQDYEERTRRMNYRRMIKEVAQERKTRRLREKAERDEKKEGEDKKQKLTLSEKFASSLGIPCKSSTSNPRHLIDMKQSNSNKSTSQMTDDERKIAVAKKLRTMMIRLESALSMIIEINEIQGSTNDESSKFKDLTKNEKQIGISQRTTTIMNELMGDDMHKLLQMAKGRTVISRLLQVVGPKDQAVIILGLMSAGGLVNRRMYGEIIMDLLPIIYTKLSALHPDQFSYLVGALNLDMLKRQLLDNNVFIRDMMLAMFYVSNKNSQLLIEWAEATKFSSLALSPNKPLTCWRKALSFINDDDIRDFAEFIRESKLRDSAELASLIEQAL